MNARLRAAGPRTISDDSDDGNAYHRKAPPIRTRSLLAAAAALLAASRVLVAAGEPLVVLYERERREILPLTRGGAEMVPVNQVLAGLGVSASPDARGTGLLLSYGGREVTIYDKKSLASVGGDLRLLSSPVLFEEGRWLVPIDGLPRLLQPLLGKRVEWRAASRLLLVGEVAAPRVTVTTSVSADAVRVVLEASEKVPFRVSQEEKRVTVQIGRELIETAARQERLTGGIVDSVQFLGGRDNTFAMTLGRRFLQLKTGEEDTRLVLEFQARPLSAASPLGSPAPGASPGQPAPPPDRAAVPPAPASGGLRTVVIDPGHGGEEVGAKGPGGTFEKDVTLAFARKLRSALANSLGVQAFLTRDRDVEVPLDDRSAFANNYKADLFISVHANASRSHGAKGSEVYFLSYQATDEESRRLAQAEGGDIGAGAGVAAGSDLALILWDMAQAEHLEASSALATRIQEELAEVTGSQGRGIKQAPFRVLVGAAMPAVLLEVAFISNPEEEKLLVSEAYQNKVVGAVVRGVARYQQQRASLDGGGAAPAPR
ncbi:MAG: N-acetylmuramoyl-L-alanine amidase [Vicinamibacteria bacterium]